MVRMVTIITYQKLLNLRWVPQHFTRPEHTCNNTIVSFDPFRLGGGRGGSEIVFQESTKSTQEKNQGQFCYLHKLLFQNNRKQRNGQKQSVNYFSGNPVLSSNSEYLENCIPYPGSINTISLEMSLCFDSRLRIYKTGYYDLTENQLLSIKSMEI